MHSLRCVLEKKLRSEDKKCDVVVVYSWGAMVVVVFSLCSGGVVWWSMGVEKV